jgi:hypothetical protein
MPTGYNWYVNKYSESESERTRRYAGRSNKIHRRSFICESCRHHITLVEDAVQLYWVTVHEKVPEHSMQCAQRNRQDHLSLLMLECIMVLCVWLECWASCNSFYSHMTRMFCITGWAFGHLCIGVWGVGREKYILLLFFSY